jgi:ABC-type branched-subunit amino acid transport system permease subunit
MKSLSDLLLSAGAIIAGTALIAYVLIAHAEWSVLAAIAVGAAMIFGAEYAGIGPAIARVFDNRTTAVALLVGLLTFGFMIWVRDDHFLLLMLATVLILGIACLGLTIQFGYVGVVNFAGAAFFGIGGYTVAMLAPLAAIPSLLLVLIAGCVGAAIASVLILPVLRTKGHYAALITIAFGILFRTFLEVNEHLGGPQGLKVQSLKIFGWDLGQSLEIGSFEASTYFNYAALALVLFGACVILARNLDRSWVGINLDVIRVDETAAASFGIDVARWRILAFLLGNFLIAVAGALYAMMSGLVAPNNFTFADSLLMISIIILAGVGNTYGVIPAAVIALVIPEKLQALGEYRLFIFAILVVLILRFRPQGLFPRTMREFRSETNR